MVATAATYTRWKDIPPNLKTKTQWGKLGRKPVSAAVAEISVNVYGHGHHTYDLYDELHTAEKRQVAIIPPTIIEPTAENIAAALYEINKAAKRRRDAGERAYDDGNHQWAARHKSEKMSHYDLKDRTLSLAIATGLATVAGNHSITNSEESYEMHHEPECESNYDGRGKCYECGAEAISTTVTVTKYFACYEIASFRFHRPIQKPDGEVTDLGNWLSPAAKCGTKMRLKDAIALLEKYTEATTTEAV